MYFHVYLIYRFTHTFADHSSVITRCWGFELQNGKSSLKSPQTLAAQGWDVDYIITHCCPSSIQDTFSGGLFRRDALTDFLDEVRERCRFQYWFFGHYHENMVVEKKFVMLYKQIIRLK